MTREETVRNLLTELIGMIDNGSQRDLDRADEIGVSIIKLFEQEPVIDKIRVEISTVYESLDGYDPDSLGHFLSEIDKILDKYKAESEKV